MDSLSFVPLGGVGEVTKNMYLYEYKDQILIVDCGIGFTDESMPGVDLLIPDVTYLKNQITTGKKKIVGMILSHGHEDHIGALPFILPQLPSFPIYGSTLTAALANAKIQEFQLPNNVTTVSFDDVLQMGYFTVSFIRVTHSIIDASNLFIKTPIGNFYHGSDFKFDFTPVDGKRTELSKITKASDEGILALFSDCVGAERKGYTPSEATISESFEEEFRRSTKKIFVTTYSSNISRLNQAVEVAIKMGKRICFVGRSLIKAKEIGRSLGYMKYNKSYEINQSEIKRFKPSEVVIFVTGSQAQENSALVRIANGDDRDITMEKADTVIFSADPIPGNETSVNALVDTMSRLGVRVIYSALTSEFHVSGHGSENDLKLLIALAKPRFVMPMGGTYRQLVAYREIAKSMGYKDDEVLVLDGGQEVLFEKNGYRFGKKVKPANIYVDEITGDPVDSYVVVDRKKISKEGVVVVIAEIDSTTGQLISVPDVLTRGFVYDKKEVFAKRLKKALDEHFGRKKEAVTNWIFYRKQLGKTAEQLFFRERREPFVVPIVLEV